VRKQPGYQLFFGLAGVSLLIGGFMVYSQWNAVSEQRDKVAEIQKQVSDSAGVRTELAASEKRLNDLKVKLAHLEKGVPDYRYIPTMLKEIEAFGNANGIHVIGMRPLQAKTSAKPDEKEETKAYVEMPIEVQGRGTYGDGLRFLRALQRFPKVVAAKTISMQPKLQSGEEVGGSPSLEITIELSLFVFPPEKETAEEMKPPASSVAVTEVSKNG
jgi:Tfp pilus assembly protein PilO